MTLTLKGKAWQLYCDETKGDMHVADFWEELPARVQNVYIQLAKDRCEHLERRPFYEDDVLMGSIYWGQQCTFCGDIDHGL
jgi:hypothetical protein